MTASTTQNQPPSAEAAAAACLAAFTDLVRTHPAHAYDAWREITALVGDAPYDRIDVIHADEDGWSITRHGETFSTDALVVVDTSERHTKATLLPGRQEIGFRYGSTEDYDDLLYLLDGRPVRLPEDWAATSMG